MSGAGPALAEWPVVNATDWCGQWSPYWGTTQPDYSATITNFAHSSAGDLLSITGSASQVVRVQRIAISATSSSAATIDIALMLRSSLDTGGTPTALSMIPSDALDPPATATVTAYATAPTAGTPVGLIRGQKYQLSPANQGGTTIPLVWLGTPNSQELVVLRGTSSALCVLVSTLAGGNWDVSVQWTETVA